MNGTKLEMHVALTRAEVWIEDQKLKFREDVAEFVCCIRDYEGEEEAAQIIEILMDVLPSR